MADLTPNNREEFWLQGMVDGQTTLEPNKRREYWYKEIVDAIGSGGGGGTGGGVVYFTVTSNDGGNKFTTDKTFAELKAAYDGGSALICLDRYNYHGCAVCVMPDEHTVFGSGLAFAYGDGSYFINGFRISMSRTKTIYDEVTI